MLAVASATPRHALRELLIVRRWPIDRRNRHIVQPQIHRQLCAMMCQVRERVSYHNMTRLLTHHIAPNQQTPGLLQMFLIRILQRLASLCGSFIERLHQFRRSAQRFLLELAASGRIQIQIILVDDQRKPQGICATSPPICRAPLIYRAASNRPCPQEPAPLCGACASLHRRIARDTRP